MTFKEWEKQILAKEKGMLSRGSLTAYMCFKQGITDETKIHNFIVKAYTKPSKEFAGRIMRTQVFGHKEAIKTIAWLKANGINFQVQDAE